MTELTNADRAAAAHGTAPSGQESMSPMTSGPLKFITAKERTRDDQNK